MRQQTCAEESFEKLRKKTRKEQSLDEMERIIPWQELTAAIEPFYPNPQGAGSMPSDRDRSSPQAHGANTVQPGASPS